MIPVRCFTCGTVVGSYWETFAKRTSQGDNAGLVLDELGLTRYCCRRMLLSHVELIDDVLPFG
ncbi:MAG: DNA-directed RNA polymerase subunit N [Euryarchaeota archaeon]|nr:DNA-directed RNA polymerase subunit N [Euryarchaeota archaeon]